MIKKLLFITAIVSIGINATAQQNPGFETWGTPFSEPEEPTGWITANVFASPLLTFPNPNPNPTSAFKLSSPNAVQGSYAVKVKTVKLLYNPDTTTIPDTLGVVMQGSVVTTPFRLVDRAPFTSRPQSFHYFFKYMPSGVDTGWFYLELSKWNSTLNRRDTVANLAFAMIGTTTNWTAQLLPLVYYSTTLMPDSIALIFSSSSGRYPKLNSELWVDDIYFTGWSSVENVSSGIMQVMAFPNPAREMITITAENEKAVQVRIYDCIGKIIGTYEMNNRSYLLNTSSLRPGNYYYSVLDKGGAPLGGNTFTVAR